jgi:hypothetical protein
MTLRPIFEIVETEMFAVDGTQSKEIAAIGFDGSRLLVQFHRLPGIYATPATREQYEELLDAESISVDYQPRVAEAVPGRTMRWHTLAPQTRAKKVK